MDTPSPTHPNHWLPVTSTPSSPALVMTNGPLKETFAQSEMPSSLILPDAATSSAHTTASSTMAPLTPPTTPEKQLERRASISSCIETPNFQLQSSIKQPCTLDSVGDSRGIERYQEPLLTPPKEPFAFGKAYQLKEVLGHGAWSVVYNAIEETETSIPSAVLPPSPPISPESKYRPRHKMVLAVKIPSEKMAQKILKEEAKILSFLHSHSNANSYLVPFYGFNTEAHAIVMAAIPQNLDIYIKSRAHGVLSTKTMFDPVVGPETWASIAEQLIDGLAFLSGVGCIHGDIKPSNILLRSDEATGHLTPLYCDFSSAHVVRPNIPSSETEEISAVTKDYLAPEILTAMRRSGERVIATPASDVFALAVTLLQAATGESPYAFARMDVQKLSMAKEGVPIDFARMGSNGSKVMKGRAVAKVLGPAVEKDPTKRIGVEAWKVIIKDIAHDWKEGGWATGG